MENFVRVGQSQGPNIIPSLIGWVELSHMKLAAFNLLIELSVEQFLILLNLKHFLVDVLLHFPSHL